MVQLPCSLADRQANTIMSALSVAECVTPLPSLHRRKHVKSVLLLLCIVQTFSPLNILTYPY